MAKLILWLALLLLPTAVYVAWFMVSQRRRLAVERGEPARWWDRAPWLTLLFSGVALLAAALIWWALTDGMPAAEVGPMSR